jgi:hypothetical protein
MWKPTWKRMARNKASNVSPSIGIMLQFTPQEWQSPKSANCK